MCLVCLYQIQLPPHIPWGGGWREVVGEFHEFFKNNKWGMNRKVSIPYSNFPISRIAELIPKGFPVPDDIPARVCRYSRMHRKIVHLTISMGYCPLLLCPWILLCFTLLQQHPITRINLWWGEGDLIDHYNVLGLIGRHQEVIYGY